MYSTPPCPSLAASTAAYRRRSFSDSHPKNRCIFCSTSAVYTSMPHSLIQDLLRGKDTTASAIRKVILHHILMSSRSSRTSVMGGWRPRGRWAAARSCLSICTRPRCCSPGTNAVRPRASRRAPDRRLLARTWRPGAHGCTTARRPTRPVSPCQGRKHLIGRSSQGGIVKLNRSTRDSYTRCHGNSAMARLRVLPVCQYCMA